jgi:hypothetical protein
LPVIAVEEDFEWTTTEESLMDSFHDDAMNAERVLTTTTASKTSPSTTTTTSSFSIGSQYIGLNMLDDIVYNGVAVVPPDPIGAVSMTTLLSAGNWLVELRTKSNGNLLYKNSFANFFSSLQPYAGSLVYDPKVVYDEYEDRLCIVALERRGETGPGYYSDPDGRRRRRRLKTPLAPRKHNTTKSTTSAPLSSSTTSANNTNATSDQVSRILMAVSKDGSPTGPQDFYFQAIDSLEYDPAPINDNFWLDYPGMCVCFCET